MVPRIIHRIWVGPPEPDWVAQCGRTWEQPGWEVRTWDDDDVERLFPLINQPLWDRADTIAGKHVWQFRSDVIRLEILHRFGGVYVDADFELLTTIDDICDGAPWATWEKDGQWIANGLIGAEADDPFIRRLIGGLPARVDRYAGDPQVRPNVVSGPHYITRMHQQHPGELTVWPQKWFYPYAWDATQPRRYPTGTRAVHHWHNQRKLRGRNAPVVARR